MRLVGLPRRIQFFMYQLSQQAQVRFAQDGIVRSGDFDNLNVSAHQVAPAQPGGRDEYFRAAYWRETG